MVVEACGMLEDAFRVRQRLFSEFDLSLWQIIDTRLIAGLIPVAFFVLLPESLIGTEWIHCCL